MIILYHYPSRKRDGGGWDHVGPFASYVEAEQFWLESQKSASPYTFVATVPEPIRPDERTIILSPDQVRTLS